MRLHPTSNAEIEARILGRLPEILLAGTVPPAACALVLDETLIRIVAVATIFGWWMTLVPLAVACLIVSLMKGPSRQAGAGQPAPD